MNCLERPPASSLRDYGGQVAHGASPKNVLLAPQLEDSSELR
jgi:hypothetical protein